MIIDLNNVDALHDQVIIYRPFDGMASPLQVEEVTAIADYPDTYRLLTRSIMDGHPLTVVLNPYTVDYWAVRDKVHPINMVNVDSSMEGHCNLPKLIWEGCLKTHYLYNPITRMLLGLEVITKTKRWDRNFNHLSNGNPTYGLKSLRGQETGSVSPNASLSPLLLVPKTYIDEVQLTGDGHALLPCGDTKAVLPIECLFDDKVILVHERNHPHRFKANPPSYATIRC